MDEFSALTERFGLKQQGKSAPMAASKRPASNGTARSFSSNSGSNSKPSSHSQNQNSYSGGFPDDILFQSNTGNKESQGRYDDHFGQFQTSTINSSNGSSLDYGSVVMGSGISGSNAYTYDDDDDDDIFGLKKNINDDLSGSFVSPPEKGDSVDDLLGGFGVGADSNSESLKQNEAGSDDLIPGFGASTSSNDGTNAKATESTYLSAKDPFIVLEAASNPAYGSSDSFTDALDELGKLTQSGATKPDGPSTASRTLKPPPKPSQVLKADEVQNPVVSSIDELEDFARCRVRDSPDRSSVCTPKEMREWHSPKASKYKEAKDAAKRTPKKSEDDLESYSSVGTRSSSVPKSRATSSDPIFDAKINRKGPDMVQEKTSGGSSHIKKASSATNLEDDFFSVLGATSAVGEFEEYEGESEERRRARLKRQQKTHDRMVKAVADFNQQEFQTQQEQEERRRIADSLNVEIKRWVAGKEGNMRALLSSLQYVLWPECGWEPVPLTDLITSSSVKKVFRKARLLLHPDKVQGANIQQKYTAEKVFNILQEAWEKFSKEEPC
ncbi:J domain-containing protein [Citrus sinensis]|uniref:J domain-containing protein n=1 Tax=Citrus sinensis TaxID=2711 RepID=A0ACB8KRU4_CITSI|nr:J domain-containing protein [Citrus sinensis]